MADLGATSAAATQPAFADAGQTADNQKQALLQAIAQAGQAGRQQYQTMQQANEADRQAALQAATQREAVVQNMPPALAQELGVKTAQPFDLGQQLYQEGQQSQANNMAQLSAAGGNYLSELKASIPVVQADVQSKVAALQDAANNQNAQRALDLQLKQLEVQKAQASSTAPGADLSKVITDNGGLQTFGTSLAQTRDQWIAQQLGNERTGGVGSGAADRASLEQQWYDSMDRYLGRPSGTTKSLIDQAGVKTDTSQATLQNKQNQIEKFNLSQQQVKSGVSDPKYNDALSLANQAAQSPNATRETLFAYLVAKGFQPNTAQVAVNSISRITGTPTGP